MQYDHKKGLNICFLSETYAYKIFCNQIFNNSNKYRLDTLSIQVVTFNPSLRKNIAPMSVQNKQRIHEVSGADKG